MDQTDDDDGDSGGGTPFVSIDDEGAVNQLLGLFDVPAFARRGADLEYALKRLHLRLARERSGMLDMVRTRLKQWASVATGHDDRSGVFSTPVLPLYAASGAEPPRWASSPAAPRRRRVIARDLVASLSRFNRRWADFLNGLDLDRVNRRVDDYNRYYVLEKECVLGSARLAARLFVPRPRLTFETLLIEYPTLPVPGLVN